MMEHQFRGRELIVVGGTSGIGKAVARIVLERGGMVVLIGRREDKTKAAVADLSSNGTVTGVTTDINNSHQRETLLTRLNSDHRNGTL